MAKTAMLFHCLNTNMTFYMPRAICFFSAGFVENFFFFYGRWYFLNFYKLINR